MLGHRGEAVHGEAAPREVVQWLKSSVQQKPAGEAVPWKVVGGVPTGELNSSLEVAVSGRDQHRSEPCSDLEVAAPTGGMNPHQGLQGWSREVGGIQTQFSWGHWQP